MLYNKDIMDWNCFPEYDIIWCDPPWGNRMIKFFETTMFKNGYEKPNNTIEGIINKLADLANKNKPIFIEYSIKGFDFVVDIMIKKGHSFCCKVSSIQENGKPYLILVFNSKNYSPDGRQRGFSIIKKTCDELNFHTVFDPFAGIGKTGKSFVSKGKHYIGSEINPCKFEKLKKELWQEQ